MPDNNKLSRSDFAVLKLRLSPEWLIRNTHVFEGGQHTAQKFKEYWKIWIADDLAKLIEETEKRFDEKRNHY